MPTFFQTLYDYASAAAATRYADCSLTISTPSLTLPTFEFFKNSISQIPMRANKKRQRASEH